MDPRIQSSRWSWLARPWRTQGRRAQQSSSSNKSAPSRGRPKSLTKEPPGHRCQKSSLFVENMSSRSSRLQGPRMKSRFSARRRQKRWWSLKMRNPDLSNFKCNWPKSTLRWPTPVWPCNRKVSTPHRHNSSFESKPICTNCPSGRKENQACQSCLRQPMLRPRPWRTNGLLLSQLWILLMVLREMTLNPWTPTLGTRDASSKRTATES